MVVQRQWRQTKTVDEQKEINGIERDNVTLTWAGFVIVADGRNQFILQNIIVFSPYFWILYNCLIIVLPQMCSFQ